MTSIETERLLVRNFKVNDWEALHEMIVLYEGSEYAAYDEQWPTSPEEIRRITEWFASGDHFLAVCLKDTSQLIGFVALNPGEGEDSQEYNIGYVFHFNYHGHGYASEACKAVLERAFRQLGASRVIAATAGVNRRSCRLLERLSFRKIGERPSSFRKTDEGKPIEFAGYIYAISREEWEDSSREPDRLAVDS